MEPHWPSLLGPKLYQTKNLINNDVSKLRIRMASQDDLLEISSLDKQYFISPWSYEAFKNEFNNTTSFIFVGELDNKVVAYLVVRIVADEMEILKIVVKDDCRRKGIAKSLLNKSLELAQDLNLDFIYLEVSKKNLPALSLYKDIGFREYNFRPNYYSKGEDALLMKLEVPSQKKEQAA